MAEHREPERRPRRYRNRDAGTGRFTTVAYALKHPLTTVRELVRRRSRQDRG